MQVMMYTLTTCSWCRKAKEYFRDSNVLFDHVDYDLTGAEEQRKILQEMSDHGSNSFPFVKIGGEVVVGYDPEKYSDLLKREAMP